MENFKALMLAILVGLFFLVGVLITKFVPKKRELTLFATGLSFTVMLGMILFDIIPEIGESVVGLIPGQKWLLIIGFTGLGMGLLKGLDVLVPHHHHDHKENEKNVSEHNEHLFHIGFVTSISLMLHNMIEGMSIYTTGLTSFKTGLMMALAVALHNIPLGMEIAVGMESMKEEKKKTWISMIALTLSSFLGAFILFLIQGEISMIIQGCFLCTTFGMLIYISLFELLREIWTYRNQKEIYMGIALGVLLNIIMVMI